MEFVRLLGICNKQKSGISYCVSLAPAAAAAAVVVALYCCFPFRWVLWKQSLSSTGFFLLLFGSERARGRIFRGALWRNKSYNRMSSSFMEPYLQPNVQ
jgi:apolipoprotein N-acyltransferase